MESPNETMQLLTTRLIALISLFSLTLLAGLGPVIMFRIWNHRKQSTILDVSGDSRKSLKHKKSTASAITLQILMFFGGGVLLATCFVHLIPEVRENFDIYYHSQESASPKASTLSGVSEAHHGHSHHDHGDHDHGSSSPHDHHHHHPPPGTTHALANDPVYHHASESSDVDTVKSSTDAELEINSTLPYNYENPGVMYDDASEVESNTLKNEQINESKPLADYRIVHQHKHKHKVPFVELAICGGFFLIYFLEELIHLIIGHDHHDSEEKDSPINIGDSDSVQTIQTCLLYTSPSPRDS